MCGIAGALDLRGRGRVDPDVVAAMTGTLVHRGPDSSGLFAEPDAALGIRRLKIIDLLTGDQPIANEDGSVVLVCNGEIFNYRELRQELSGRGHTFRTQTDVEVLVHLYEELGEGLAHRLNGQFAFAIYDRNRRRLLLARDPFGINPLHVCQTDGLLLFASEIKAILRHPEAPRRVDLVGLDQVLSFPGLIAPRTMFAGVESLPPGHLLVAEDGEVKVREYWDLDYPQDGEPASGRPEGEVIEELREIFGRSVERRLQADVPVGLFLSGGMDSSLVSAVASQRSKGVPRHSFSAAFESGEIDESRYQRLVARALDFDHHEIAIGDDAMLSRLRRMVFHCECPVKESFNTCSLALAEAAREAGVPVVLGGEGADELFGGYPGYRFDAAGGRETDPFDVEAVLEEELRERIWGDRRIFYERDQLPLREVKSAFYSAAIAARFEEVDCLNHPLVNPERLRGRHPLHQRSYLDFKLRLGEHLLSEHGDRMVMAHSIEGRYPFLDVELVDFVRGLPPSLKVNGMVEKYAVRKMAEGLVPQAILEREKFGFRAPGSPLLLQRGLDWVEELLAPERIRRQGYFNPETVARLKERYSRPGFRLHPHLETDYLMIVLTFNLLLEDFQLPNLS